MTRTRSASWPAALAAILLVGGIAGCSTASAGPQGSGDPQRHLQVGGFDRTYRVHLPAGHSAATGLPVVILLHGRGGTAEGNQELTHFDRIADRNGFLAVHPQGYQRSWADVPPNACWC